MAMFTHRSKTTWIFNSSPSIKTKTFNSCLCKKGHFKKEEKAIRDDRAEESKALGAVSPEVEERNSYPEHVIDQIHGLGQDA